MKISGRMGSFKKFREEGSTLMKQTVMEHVINPSPSSLLF
jgi:hypothetical protein